jgi:hypothetical protein
MHAEAPDGYSKIRPESDAKMARVGVADVSGPSTELAASSRLPRPRAILFDWDNTLVDSWVTIHEALNITMAAMDKPLWSIEQTKERVRLSLRESFPRHFGERWEEARRIYLDKFSAIHLDRLTALPGRGELLVGLVGAVWRNHRRGRRRKGQAGYRPGRARPRAERHRRRREGVVCRGHRCRYPVRPQQRLRSRPAGRRNA